MANQFTRARKRAGYPTIYAACEAMEGVGRQTLANIEADPEAIGRARSGVAWQLLRTYWPHLSLRDVFGPSASGFLLVEKDQ